MVEINFDGIIGPSHNYSGLSLGNVASATGFSSHGHFTSTFHRVVGAIPSQYREGK